MRFRADSIHITLVRPPVLELSRNLSSYGAILPIGLAYIAAVLRDAGHKIKVIDAPGEAIDRFRDHESPIGTLTMNGLTPKEIVDRIDPATEVLGITHMFLHEWPTIKEIVSLAKEKNPDLIIILGGENATAFWKWILDQSDAVDYCILGEGEATMLEVIARLRLELPLDDIQGVVSRTQDRSIKLRPSARSTDLKSIPTPAWEYFPVEEYMQIADHHGVNRGRSMPMLATRGCPYQCTFCSSPQMWTTKYVTRNPQDVVEEMKSYVKKYQINNVNFCDLTAIIKREWIIEFCTLLKHEKMDLTWQLPTGTRSEVLDAEVLRLAYETGCRNITYAPESGSERMLRVIKKKVKIPRMLDSLKMAHRANVVTRVNIIIGHPEEKREDWWHDLKFLAQCALIGCQDAAVMIFAPYPGSEDFMKLMAQNRVNFTEQYYYLALARSGWTSKTYNPLMSTKELVIVQYIMLLVFYAAAYLTHPFRIIKFFRSLFTGYEETQLDQLIRTKLQRFLRFRKQEVSASTRGS